MVMGSCESNTMVLEVSYLRASLSFALWFLVLIALVLLCIIWRGDKAAPRNHLHGPKLPVALDGNAVVHNYAIHTRSRHRWLRGLECHTVKPTGVCRAPSLSRRPKFQARQPYRRKGGSQSPEACRYHACCSSR